MLLSNIKKQIKRRSLTPTANPLERINASLKKYSIDVSSYKQNETQPSELTPYLKNPLYRDNSHSNYFSLNEKQSIRYQPIKETSQGTNKVAFINEKIDSILSNYKANTCKKQVRSKLKSNKVTQKQNINRIPKSLKKQKQNSITQKFNVRKKLQMMNYQQKPRITLKDITIENISFNQSRQFSQNIQMKKQQQNKCFKQRDTPNTVNYNTNFRYSEENEHNLNSISFKSTLNQYTNCPFSLNTDLRQLQNTTYNIDSILLNLEKDFIKNEDNSNVYVNQNIRVPKIFRKNKKRELQRSKDTQSEQKQSLLNCNFNNQTQKIINRSMIDLRSSSSSQSSEILKLMTALNNQILLDNKFKRIKYWFKKLKSQSKWKVLQNELRRNRLWINQLSMKTIFLLENEQQNPFESIRQDQYTIKDLIKALKSAEQHWNRQICNKFDDQRLIIEGLTQQTIDVGHRGYIAIEDLIRFINCRLKHYYCNRDINLIYIRLKGSEKLSFSQFLTKISKEHK